MLKDNLGQPGSFDLIVNVEETKWIGGSTHTEIGNNEGSLVNNQYLFIKIFNKLFMLFENLRI